MAWHCGPTTGARWRVFKRIYISSDTYQRDDTIQYIPRALPVGRAALQTVKEKKKIGRWVEVVLEQELELAGDI